MKENGLNDKRFQAIKRKPELVPLTEEQKEAFLYFWKAMPEYSRRQQLISAIPDHYENRSRYKALLTEEGDIRMFNLIMKDDDTLF